MTPVNEEYQSPILLIDGDVLCYNACENRYKNENGFTVVTLEEPVEDPVADALYLEKAYERLLTIINDLVETCFATEYRCAVAGVGNYRKDLYPEYKMNRHADPKKRNPFVPKLRKMLADGGRAVEAHGMEADDQLRIWARELYDKGIPYIIVSIDKDLLMIPGQHYRIHHKQFVTMTPEASMKFYYEQLLMGDATDNIKGVPRVGPVKAQRYLEGCITEEDHQAVVMQVYYTAFGKEEWRKELNLTGQLIYIKETKDSWFSCDGWKEPVFEEVEIKPIKVKKAKKVDPWTIETAVAAINPTAIVTSERWESAMMFLVESGDLPDNLMSAVEALANRNKVPLTEIDAYQEIAKHFSKAPKIATPTIAIPDITMVPINLTVMGAAKSAELIVIGASEGTGKSMFNFKPPAAPEAVALASKIDEAMDIAQGKTPVPDVKAAIANVFKMPETTTVVKPQCAPMRILSNTSDGVHPPPATPFVSQALSNKFSAPIKRSIAPPVVPVPTFSASWGKKK